MAKPYAAVNEAAEEKSQQNQTCTHYSLGHYTNPIY